jgi:hypothetical protein
VRAAAAWLSGRWAALRAWADQDEARSSVERRLDAEAAAARARIGAMDAVRALEQGEWDEAAELLGRARRSAREAVRLDQPEPPAAGGGWL